MSYQRFGKPGRFYIWMGSDGLHIWTKDENSQVIVYQDAAGVENAKAMLLGLVDVLMGAGVNVEIDKRGVHFKKLEGPHAH